MPLQTVPINFAQGIDTKTDPWQIPIGKFSSLVNSVFTKTNQLKKRNGYPALPALPDSTSNCLTTFNENLTALGTSVAALNEGANSWVSKGSLAPLSLSTLPLIRNSINQIQCDTAIAPNGLICSVYTQNNAGASVYRYAIADSTTGQNIVSPTAIPVSSGTVTGSPRVFVIGDYFVIVFTNVITAVSHLQYICISSFNPTVATANADIAAAYISSTRLSWDGVVSTNALYIAYNTTTGGQSIKVTYLTLGSAIVGGAPATAVTFAAEIATIMSLCADETTTPLNPTIYVSYYDSASSVGKMLAVDLGLITKMSPTSVITSGTVLNIATTAQLGACTYFYEVDNNYSYDSAIPSHYVAKRVVTLPATVTTGTVSPAAGSAASGTIVARSVGLASKGFIVNAVAYFLSAYQSPYQSTYFLINGSTSLASAPVVVAKLAYENGGGYLAIGLPSVFVDGLNASFGYLVKDFIAAQSTVSATPVSGEILGVYSQTGINLVAIEFGASPKYAEIASNLHLSGGFLWAYDGYLPVEHNFFLYPDSVEVTTADTGGFLADQDYFYIGVYEWEDNQGNVYRSGTSIAVKQTTTGGDVSANTINIPYLRLTYKVANPAKLVLYRWSTGQPVFYRITSLTSVQSNLTTSDSLAFVDTLADASILGNDILYTTGGVVEDNNAPSLDSVFPFDDRLWGIDAENKNLLRFSKQVLDNTPVEMSELFTYFVAPTVGAQGPTGPLKCGAAMDDKLVLFKASAMSYINGTGPDNTGANSGYSPSPIFITSTIGCTNQKSIVFQPQGLMFEFQSEAGNQIWLLGRDLSTNYIGAPVEELTANATIQSAVNIPGTNQVRFTLSSGITLMYDYFQSQWGTFEGVSAVSSCVFEGVHAFINDDGKAFQEDPGTFLDGSQPVLMSITTGWINVAGLQGYLRANCFYILGKYYSPHKLYVQVAYDYNDSPLNSIIITPDNFSAPYGGAGPGEDDESPYGQQANFGGPGNVEQWRVFFKKQRCQAFKITITEVYDASLGQAAGQGLSLSGINLVLDMKKAFWPIASAKSKGAS